MEELKIYKFDDILDKVIGPNGTPEREEFHRSVKEAVNASKIGEAIKTTRTAQNLTQEELGKRIGVNKSHISCLEHGKKITLPIISRVFHALGGNSATLDIAGVGRIALW